MPTMCYSLLNIAGARIITGTNGDNSGATLLLRAKEKRELNKGPVKLIAAAKVEGVVCAGGIAICEFYFF